MRGWKIALTSLVIMAFMHDPMAETRALLVGVSSYRNLDESLHLAAPRNDS